MTALIEARHRPKQEPLSFTRTNNRSSRTAETSLKEAIRRPSIFHLSDPTKGKSGDREGMISDRIFLSWISCQRTKKQFQWEARQVTYLDNP